MENPSASIQHVNLRDLLREQAALYSTNEGERLRLVERTLNAASFGIDLNPSLSVQDALFEVLHDIAKTDFRQPPYGGYTHL